MNYENNIKGDLSSPLILPQIEMPIITDYLNESEYIQKMQTTWCEYINHNITNNIEIELDPSNIDKIKVGENDEGGVDMFIPANMINNIDGFLKENSAGVLFENISIIGHPTLQTDVNQQIDIEFNGIKYDSEIINQMALQLLNKIQGDDII